MNTIDPFKNLTSEELKILTDPSGGIGKGSWRDWKLLTDKDKRDILENIRKKASSYKEPLPNPYSGEGLVRCEICGRYLRIIHILHLRTHGISLEDYKGLFPNSSIYSEDLRKQQSQSHKNLPRSPETCRLISENNRRRWEDPEERKTLSAAIRASMSSPDFRRERSEICKKNWKDPEYVRKTMESKAKAIKHIARPNMEELDFLYWVETFRPNSIKYNTRYIPQADLTPDFIVIGQKKVIEYFGVYWHSPFERPGMDTPSEAEYIARYAKAGCKCLIVWSFDVLTPDTRKEIEDFIDA